MSLSQPEVERLFMNALDQPPAERLEWLHSQEALAEAALEARSLIEAVSREDDYLERPAFRLRQLQSWEGRRIGVWELESKVGEGGMGMVYSARRWCGGFSQRAAAKLAVQISGCSDLEKRFEREREILAQLEHPGIARLLDGGTTEEGVPYLVMELVEGQAIDRYCRERHCDWREVLDLFLQAAEAMAYAHQQLVVHSDLKPEHLSVDAGGRVRILDFGIASVLEGRRSSQCSSAALTPAYASPEQLAGKPARVPSDVYSLGACLVRVVTGQSPDESTRALEAVNVSSDLKMPKSVRKDLCLVLSRAMSEDGWERYPSMDALAAEFRRLLEYRPVAARPDTLRYRLQRAIRRNRMLSCVIVLAVTGLFLFTVALYLQSRALEVERDLARGAEQDARLAAGVMRDFLRATLSTLPLGARAELTKALDTAVASAHRQAIKSTEVRLEISQSLGSFYNTVGDYESAREVLSDAVRSAGAAQPLTKSRLARAHRDLGIALRNLGAIKRSEENLRAALRLQIEASGAYDPEVALIRGFLAENLDRQGRSEDSIAQLRLALEEQTRLWGTEHPNRTQWQVELATALARSDHLEEASQLEMQARGTLAVVEPEPSIALANIRLRLGELSLQLGRPELSERDARACFDIAAAKLGFDNPSTIAARVGIVKALAAQHRYDQAAMAARAALALAIDHYPPSSSPLVVLRTQLADIEIARGAIAEAEELLDEVFLHVRQADLRLHPQYYVVRGRLALATGRPEVAVRAFEDASSRLAERAPPALSDTGEISTHLAAALAQAGRLEEAQAVGRQGLAMIIDALGEEHPRVADARFRLQRSGSTIPPGVL